LTQSADLQSRSRSLDRRIPPPFSPLAAPPFSPLIGIGLLLVDEVLLPPFSSGLVPLSLFLPRLYRARIRFRFLFFPHFFFFSYRRLAIPLPFQVSPLSFKRVGIVPPLLLFLRFSIGVAPRPNAPGFFFFIFLRFFLSGMAPALPILRRVFPSSPTPKCCMVSAPSASEQREANTERISGPRQSAPCLSFSFFSTRVLGPVSRPP